MQPMDHFEYIQYNLPHSRVLGCKHLAQTVKRLLDLNLVNIFEYNIRLHSNNADVDITLQELSLEKAAR